jgi:TRAP transporter TAXI family solute receptor
MRMKRIAMFMLVVMLLILTGCSNKTTTDPAPTSADTGSEAPKISTKRLAVAGGPAGGAYYPIALACAEVWMENIDGLTVDVVNTAGSVENPLLIGQNEFHTGQTTSDTLVEAYNGTLRFEGMKQSDLRLFFTGVSQGVTHIVVGKDITDISQLKGKHIAMGTEGSSTPARMMSILNGYGITADDITVSYMDYTAGMQALVDGQVDCSVAGGAAPIASVQELAANRNFEYRLLSVDQKIAESIIKDNPSTIIYKVPAGTYNRQDYDVIALSNPNVMVINANVEEELVYQMTKSIFENLDVIHKAHASTFGLSLETATSDLGVPYHPGAVRYFREIGAMK